jgi:type IV fimbrial biogenesis protein FimT
MIKRDKEKISIKSISQQSGFTLVELLAVIALLSLMLFMGLPLIQSQYYARELEHTARQFIRHAQFARQHALYSGIHTAIRPREEGGEGWGLGWQIKTLTSYSADGMTNSVLVHYDLPASIQIDSHRFRDPHTKVMQIIFNPAGAAKTQHGGFVANRLVVSHAKASHLQRHIILAASGRWRICDPNTPASKKDASC